MNNKLFFLILILLGAYGCKDDVLLPKPKAQLRLEYPKAKFQKLTSDIYEFDYNTLASVKNQKGNSLTIDYPAMKGSIYITYKPVENNLEKLMADAQRLSYEHVVKADGIETDVFENKENKVYGMLYEVKGNAASQSQFYVTDSLKHFLTGSVYFYTKPNYDSIYPAAAYIQKDIRSIMESLEWKN